MTGHSFNLSEDEMGRCHRREVLKGSFAPSHFAAAYWRQQDRESLPGAPVGGAIVNTTSESGLYGRTR